MVHNIHTYIHMATKYKPLKTKDITTQLFSQNLNKNLAWPGLPHLTLVKPDWCPDSDPGWLVGSSVRQSVRPSQGPLFVVHKGRSSSSKKAAVRGGRRRRRRRHPFSFPGPWSSNGSAGGGRGRFGGGDGDDEEARRKRTVVCGGGEGERRREGRGGKVRWQLHSMDPGVIKLLQDDEVFYKLVALLFCFFFFFFWYNNSAGATTSYVAVSAYQYTHLSLPLSLSLCGSMSLPRFGSWTSSSSFSSTKCFRGLWMGIIG